MTNDEKEKRIQELQIELAEVHTQLKEKFIKVGQILSAQKE